MQQLDVTDVQQWVGRAGAALLLDVRETWEVPRRLLDLDPAQPILCICHHGVRSAQVVAFLEQAGYGSVYNLAGGIDAWSARVDPAVPRY
jgi:rhodanese-related sulfurtransferase